MTTKMIIKKEDFDDHTFSTLLASGDGRRLWARVKFLKDYVETCIVEYLVENLRNDCEIVLITPDFNDAIETFNNLN